MKTRLLLLGVSEVEGCAGSDVINVPLISPAAMVGPRHAGLELGFEVLSHELDRRTEHLSRRSRLIGALLHKNVATTTPQPPKDAKPRIGLLSTLHVDGLLFEYLRLLRGVSCVGLAALLSEDLGLVSVVMSLSYRSVTIWMQHAEHALCVCVLTLVNRTLSALLDALPTLSSGPLVTLDLMSVMISPISGLTTPDAVPPRACNPLVGPGAEHEYQPPLLAERALLDH